MCYLVRLANGVQRYQRRADHSVPDQSFVPQLHHQAGLQVIDLTADTDRHSTYRVKEATGGGRASVLCKFC